MRSLTFFLLVVTTTLFLGALLYRCLIANGFMLLDAFMIAAFIVKAVWVSIMFWNSVFGFVLLRAYHDPLVKVFPKAANVPERRIEKRTAIVMTVRDEEPQACFSRLMSIKTSLDATPDGSRFDYFMLSDSSQPDIIASEERLFERWQSCPSGAGRVHYRRRSLNLSGKHGNLLEFCERYCECYEHAIVLDADSLMTAKLIRRLVCIMETCPDIGILQSLNAGILPPSLLARVFEFGHRHGMHCWIVGCVWWQGARGQYRGHNAIIRVAPFAKSCRLKGPEVTSRIGTNVLGHDQIEAILMHRAGFGIWEFPEDGGSYEGIPATLIGFTRRYNRWFKGNLKNLKLLGLAGLTAFDRYHLIGVAHRFLGWPSMVLFAVLAAAAAASWPAEVRFDSGAALTLMITYLAVYFTPKALGIADVILRSGAIGAGPVHLTLGFLLDVLLTVLFVPIAMVQSTWFLIKLMAGHPEQLRDPPRDSHRLDWKSAWSEYWPQPVFGLLLLAFLCWKAPGALPWFLPFLAGPVLAVPFAVLTSSAQLNSWSRRLKLCALPEEMELPEEVGLILGCGQNTSVLSPERRQRM